VEQGQCRSGLGVELGEGCGGQEQRKKKAKKKI
jgi:hypothetical protein